MVHTYQITNHVTSETVLPTSGGVIRIGSYRGVLHRRT